MPYEFMCNTNPWKNFDVLRCVECDGIIKVPKTAMEFKCIHCDTLNVFEIERLDDEEET
jgi:phage FluMu protein Com